MSLIFEFRIPNSQKKKGSRVINYYCVTDCLKTYLLKILLLLLSLESRSGIAWELAWVFHEAEVKMIDGAAIGWRLDWGYRIFFQDSSTHGCWLRLMVLVAQYLVAEGINSSPCLSTGLPQCHYSMELDFPEWVIQERSQETYYF